MFFNKRVLCTAVLIVSVCLIPVKGMGQSSLRDPYSRKSFLLTMDFEYIDDVETYVDGSETLNRTFQQIYTLDMKGNLWDRRLLIYDAIVVFDKTNFKTETIELDYDLWQYGLRTTLMPNFRFPLSLYANRHTRLTSGAFHIENEVNTYGLNWLMKFRVLPVTRISAERIHVKDSNSITSETENDLVAIEMDKDIGPTTNRLSYIFNQSDDKRSDINDQEGTSVTFQNQTRVSRHTRFTLNVIRSIFKNPETTEVGSGEVTGFDTSVSSRPSENFEQNHGYSYFENKGDQGVQKGQSFSGAMRYQFTKRASSRFSILFSENKNRTETLNLDTDSVSINGNLRYTISNNLAVSEFVSFYKTDVSTPVTLTEEAGRKRVSAITTVFYNRKFNWARLFSSVGLGYEEEEVEPFGGGRGVSGSVNFTLSAIDLKFVDMETGLNWFKFESTGEAFEERREYFLNARSKFWEKYVKFIAQYDNSSYDAWIDVVKTENENLRFNANSTYFRNTTLNAFAQYTRYFTPLSDESKTKSAGFNVFHRRVVLGGLLDASFRFSRSYVSYRGGEETNTGYNVIGKYTRFLLRRFSWDLTVEYTDNRYEFTFYKSLTVNNALTYRLRAWQLSAEYLYGNFDETHRSWDKNRLMMRATRSFFRVL